MRKAIKYRSTVIVTTIFLTAIAVFSKCMNNENETVIVEKNFESYAGDEKCASCHKDIYNSHLKTAHHLTSQTADKKNIIGSFEKGKNYLSYNSLLKVVMEKRDSGFYQVIYYKNKEDMAIRFDIVVGSGRRGQSYINQRQNHYYQMPVSFFTAAAQWSNSPGFPHNDVLIGRPITARCLECHASFAQAEDTSAMEPFGFITDKTILGVGCEKCHGPAAKHVEYQTENPNEKKAKFIVNPQLLSRQQQLDICALCHGGKIKKVKPSFSFTAGENLADYFTLNSANQITTSSDVEVHGNQYGLLRSSKCFIKSNTLTCNTCHNTHENEGGNSQLFSSRCISCHDTKGENFKSATHMQLKSPEQNCISCHMPQYPSKAIAVFLEGHETPVASMIRSHFIGIYPDETKKFFLNDSSHLKAGQGKHN